MSIVTISRGSMSGGAKLAQQLGSQLGCRVVSREVVVEAAKTLGIPEDNIAEGLETPPGLWARFTGHATSYVLAVQAALADIIENESVVYHGLAGQFLLQELPGVLKVRLIAPLEYRLQAAMGEHGLTRQQALERVHEVDRQRERWVRKLYNADWGDPSHYDVVLNLGDMSVETAADTVVQLLDRKEYRRSSEVKRAQRDFALSTRVRAHLRFRSTCADCNITVAARDGVVRLTGDPAFEARRDEVVRFVREVRGVKSVAFDGTDEGALAVVTQDTTAREMMVPLERYPHIHDWVSIRDAFVALSSSSVRLDDGHIIHPRYVLVLDRADNLVGVVGRRDLLRSISPDFRRMQGAMEALRNVLPSGTSTGDLTIGWSSLFSAKALDCARDPVRVVVVPVRSVVGVDDSLSVVVSTMIQHQVDIVPVLDGTRVRGVVVMTDIFDYVAQHIMEAGAAIAEKPA